MQTAQRVPVVSPGGIIERIGSAFTVDAEKINRVIRRILRGIFYSEIEEVLSASFGITFETPETFERFDPESKSLIERTVLAPLSSF